MTQIDDTPDVLEFGGAAEDRDQSNDHIAFQLGGGDVLHAKRPKMAVLLEVAAALSDDSNPLVQAGAFDALFDKILEVDSADAIRARLADPEDELDLDSPGIENMFRTLVGLWYGGRPTGRSAGSSRSPARTGKRSTVRARSRG